MTQKTIHVRILPREGILDPQGKAIAHALHNMGFGDVADVRAGKLIRLSVPANVTQADVQAMCERLLVNPIIEDYQIEDVA